MLTKHDCRTHDSMNARKAHNTGRNHVSNVRDYFAGLGHDKAQNIIDAIIQSHETGGRAQMMAAPSMRVGAGFMNPMAAPPMSKSSGQTCLWMLIGYRLPTIWSARWRTTIPSPGLTSSSIQTTIPTQWYAKRSFWSPSSFPAAQHELPARRWRLSTTSDWHVTILYQSFGASFQHPNRTCIELSSKSRQLYTSAGTAPYGQPRHTS